MNARKPLFLLSAALMSAAFTACVQTKENIRLEHVNDTTTIVHIQNPSKYLLLPVQETSAEGKVKLDTGNPADMAMDVRLAVDSADYFVPFELPEGADEATVVIGKVNKNAGI